jgi:hypothetical protein
MQDRHPQFDEIFLQRTAGPYIRVKNGPGNPEFRLLQYLWKRTSLGRVGTSQMCQKQRNSVRSAPAR